MTEPITLAEFPNCPNCGSTETISHIGTNGLRESGKISVDTPTQLRQNVIPLEQPVMAGVTVPCIITYFDVCAACGMERCTRAQLIQAPVQMQGMPFGTNRPSRNDGGGNFPFLKG